MKQPSHADRRPHPVFIAHLRGTQAQMGAQHGAMVRAVGGWQEVMDYYPRMPEILIGGEQAVARMAVRPLVELGVTTLERARPRALRARTRACMEALGLPAGMSRHYQAMDVFQNIVNMAGRYRLGPFAERIMDHAPAACSTLVCWGATSDDGTLRHARNFDFPGVGVWERSPSVVFCSPDRGLRYGFVTVMGADVPAVSVFNEAGLTITSHTRFHREVQWRGAGVVDLVHEIGRQARTLAQAEAIIRARPISSSWGIVVASASEGRAVSFEVHGRRVEVVEPGAGQEFMAATNRYVHPAMQQGEVTISPAFVRNSDGRYGLLVMKALEGGMTLADMQAALGSHEDVELPGTYRAAGGVPAQALSVHSVVMEPEAGCVHLSVGPAPTGSGPWARVDWSWKDAPGFHIARFDDEELPVHRCPHFGQGAPALGLEAFVEAAAIAGRAGDPAQAVAALERAVAHDDQEPTYRLMAGGARLQRGDAHGALEHFYEGLSREESPFYKGQLLLWASRAAAAGADAQVAANLRRELSGVSHPLLAQAHAAAAAEVTNPLGLDRLKKVRLNYHLADLQV